MAMIKKNVNLRFIHMPVSVTEMEDGVRVQGPDYPQGKFIPFTEKNFAKVVKDMVNEQCKPVQEKLQAFISSVDADYDSSKAAVLKHVDAIAKSKVSDE